MKVLVAVATVREVTETVSHEYELPYYGREPKTGAVIRIEPKTYDHLPDRLEKVILLEATTKTGALAIKQSTLKAYPDVPASLVTHIKRYAIKITEEEYQLAYDKTLAQARSL